ncbi:MAG: (deoxy)nucleoside triphosphate pyrophosphohydrolase [Phycisphaerae bacterium]|nr:(deoxy)nucleoside triphosphate pyrophosphohydrolase [Phycisphaerae bacterium]
MCVLITQRKAGGLYPGYWEFPGGKVDQGETVDSCVIRELNEEVGISAIVFGFLSDVEYAYPHGKVRLHPRLCRMADGSAEPRDLHVAAHRWVRPEELSSYRFPEANESIVRELLDALSRGVAS